MKSIHIQLDNSDYDILNSIMTHKGERSYILRLVIKDMIKILEGKLKCDVVTQVCPLLGLRTLRVLYEKRATEGKVTLEELR